MSRLLRRSLPILGLRALIALSLCALLAASGVGLESVSAHSLYEKSQPASGGRLQTPKSLKERVEQRNDCMSGCRMSRLSL